MAAHAAGRAALARVLREGRDLDRAVVRAGQGGRGARRRHHDGGLGVLARGAEPDDLRAAGETDARDPAAGPALGAHHVGGEVQQLGVGGDEAEGLLAGGELEGAHHLVVALEGDDLPLVAGQDLGGDALDDAVAGAQRQAGPVGLQTGEGERTLAGREVDDLAQGEATLQ